MPGSLNDWAKQVVTRVDEKVEHSNQMLEQKLDYQQKHLEQKLSSISDVNTEKLLSLSTKLEETISGINGYKELLQQQLTLLDSSVKKAHLKSDKAKEENENLKKEIEDLREDIEKSFSDIEKKLGADLTQLRKEMESEFNNLDTLETDLKKIQAIEQAEQIEKDIKKNDPMRKFVHTNAQKVLVFILTAIGLFLLRNLGSLIKFIQGLWG